MSETKKDTPASYWDWETLLAKHETIVIATDLEPDDLVALVMLRKMTEKHKDLRLIFLVGEGNSVIKEARMLEYVKLLKFCDDRPKDQIQVIRGMSSDIDFSLDGQDVLTNEIIEVFRKRDNVFTLDEMMDLALKITNEQVLYISLKPPRELYSIWKIFSYVFGKITMIGYMSFNLRALLTAKENKDDDPQMIESFLKSFSKVLYYETFIASNESSIDIGMKTTPQSIYAIFSPLSRFIINLMIDWNNSTLIRYESKKENGETLSEKQMRIKKSIQDNEGIQFVNADPGLIAFLLFDNKEEFLVPSQVSFDKDTHFSLFSSDHASNIHIVKPLEDKKNVFFEKQLTIYKNLLC